MEDKNCISEEKLFLYLDGELPRNEIPEFEEHLETCVECREEMNLLLRLEKDFNEEIELPGNFTCLVMEKIKQEKYGVSILHLLGLVGAFLAILILIPSTNPLPILGDLVARVILVLKSLPLNRLATELFSQNVHFMVSYITLTLGIILYFKMKERQKPRFAQTSLV